jgi:hypothetical protein
MAITNAQQYQQLVNPPMKGKKRPGYRGGGMVKTAKKKMMRGGAVKKKMRGGGMVKTAKKKMMRGGMAKKKR